VTVILVTKEGEDLQVNWWNWRPTLELLRSYSVLDEVTIEMMGVNGTGIQVTGEEALRIAAFLESYVKQLRPNDRVQLDLTISDEAHRIEMRVPDPDFEMHYGATRSWLERLGGFCRSSKGFSVC
jgi:hypothetical protein